MTVYNGIRAKELNQINSQDGKAYAAVSAPDYFLKNGKNLFSPKRTGNQVRFFTTGEDYFKDVATAIDKASKCIFITGWQINYDVLLDGKRSLWQCLRQALLKQGMKIYVMPWLSPSGSVGTYDFETMLAIFQLNAGLADGPRAFCIPAIQQSDMKGLGVAFSHHQKSIVIDNKIAYVGGIDLAYGRCDDNNFSLNAKTRKGNDAYNPGLPKLDWMELDKHVSSMGLIMATLFDLSRPVRVPYSAGVTGVSTVPLPASQAEGLNALQAIADLYRSPPNAVIRLADRAINSAAESLDVGFQYINDVKQRMLWKSIQAVARLINENLDLTPMTQELKLQLNAWLQELQTAGAQYTASLRIKSIDLISRWMSQTDLGQAVTILSGKGFEDIPGRYREEAGKLASSLLLHIYQLLQERSGQHLEPYPYLHTKPQPLASPDNLRLADDQPRMPWQDVHCRIEGPSVYDVSRNFIDRWNGQQAYVAEAPTLAETTRVRHLLEAMMRWVCQQARDAGVGRFIDIPDNPSLSFSKPQPVWINAPEQLPEAPTATPGGMSVQVLRSAASRMVQQEAAGRRHAGINLPLPPGIDNASVQTNCKDAMLQAISSAEHFLYIENQFFQSAYGGDRELFENTELSGPMASLRDPATLPQDLVARVRLREALKTQDIWQLDWQEIDAIAQEPGAETQRFLNDMLAIWGVNAQGWLTHRLGDEQGSLLNNIGEALANRIGRAIDERLPFHVYLVLPVHPEGALNVPNIMHQVSLTMQSLVFGEHSLIKRIQRRMALREQLDRGASREQALEGIEYPTSREPGAKRVYQQQDWTRYLTLLNLRTWENLGGRVVTEQIYVHSKLLIADDRVAILGSANINDRSLEGERDSELAVIVRDSKKLPVMLDGQNTHIVGEAIQQLRVALWKKHFGLSMTRPSGVSPATGLERYLEQPAAEETWRAIQRQAQENSELYNRAFDFIPQDISQVQPRKTPDLGEYKETGFPAPIWPTWAYRDLISLDLGGELMEPMPYEERFWRSPTLAAVRSFAPPTGVQGFICALPTHWTCGENNDSGLNLSILAQTGEHSWHKTTAHTNTEQQAKENLRT